MYTAEVPFIQCPDPGEFLTALETTAVGPIPRFWGTSPALPRPHLTPMSPGLQKLDIWKKWGPQGHHPMNTYEKYAEIAPLQTGHRHLSIHRFSHMKCGWGVSGHRNDQKICGSPSQTLPSLAANLKLPLFSQELSTGCFILLHPTSQVGCPVVSGFTLLVPIVTSYIKTWAISVEPWWKIAHKISHSHPKPSFGELKFIKDHWHHWAGWPMVGVSLGLTTCIATFLISWGHIFLLKSPFFGG